jgi:hypothetical protein
MKWFMAAALSLTAFLAMARSVVAPVTTGPSGLEYLFLAPTLIELLLVAAGAVALTLALRAWAIGMAARHGDVAAARTGRWMAPLGLLALSLAPLAVFLPGLARAGSPFVFIGYDLRFWILTAALLLTARELDRVLHGHLSARLRPVRRWSGAARLLAWDAGIFVVLIAWPVLTMATMRFSGDVHGDEPKYLRYAESWYQGNGFDLTPKGRISDMPLDGPSRITRNFALLGGALVEEAAALAGDLREFARSPMSFRWNRAQGGDNWFLRGKNGGLYQVHTPGVSAVMFPAYVLDRHLLDLKAGYQGEVPANIFMVNVTLLLVYAVWGVVLFRLLRRLFGSDRFAAALAVLAMITLPVTSFAFQLYPETSAGLALTGVLIFLLFPRADGTAWRALAFGLLCGFLPWAHIRLSLLSLVVVAYALLPRAGEWRQRRAFVGGWALMVALMCAYAYRLTGSPMPNAMFAAEGTADPFDASLIAPYFVGYMVDRIWGILPHVPVYLLAFLGLGPLWRANRAHAVLFIALYLSLAIPSAAHSLNAAGATPGRHLVAVLPLAAWPLGLAMREWWQRRAFRAAFATLTLLSLQAALVYNWWHTKDTGRMWDVSISGWKVNLLFGWTHGDVWATSQGNFILFLLGMVGIVSLIVIGVVRRFGGSGVRGQHPDTLTSHHPIHTGSHPHSVTPSLLAAGLLVTALAGVGAAALTGDPIREDYVQDPFTSRREALTRLAEIERCTLCAASGRGQVDARTMTWNGVEQFDVFIEPGEGGEAHFRLVATTRDRQPSYGHVRLEYGDGTYSPALAVAGLRRMTHVYPAPGLYRVTAWLTLPDGTRRETHTEVLVR